MTILKIDSLNAGYGAIQVLWNVGLSIEDSETVALLGPNGAGKTSLITAIVGLLSHYSGRIEIDGADVTGLSYVDRLKFLGWVPEGRQLFGDLTVEDNLHLAAWMAGGGRDFSARRKRVLEFFPPLGEKLNAPAKSLSGGQQQMLAIARALVRRPKLVLLDEPSLGLAPSVILVLSDVMKALGEVGVAVLVSEQNVSWLQDLKGRAYVMQGGRIVNSGGMDLLRSRDALRAAYLGR